MELKLLGATRTQTMEYLEFETAEQATFAHDVLNMFEILTMPVAGDGRQVAVMCGTMWREVIRPWRS